MADSSQLTQGGSEVRRSYQSTIVGAACTELRHSDRNLRTAWFEKGDYRMDVYTHFQHTFMFKQLVKWIDLMTPLNSNLSQVYHFYCIFDQINAAMVSIRDFF